jgi:small conductance mechanosensitive channel
MNFLQVSKLINILVLKMDRWLEAFIKNIPNMIVAVLVLIAFKYISSYLSRLLSRIIGRTSHNVALVGLIGTLIRLSVYMVGVFFALGVLGLDKTVTSLVAGAGVLALAVGFAFQDLTTNFISGAFIAIQRPIKVGDVIDTNGFSGKVKSIGLRSVKLDNQAGQQVELPSKDIFQKPIVNYSNTFERKVVLNCRVSYESDLTFVEELSIKTVEAFDFTSSNYKVEFAYTDFGESSIIFQLSFWVILGKAGTGKAKSEVIKAIKSAFDQHNITIPS